MQIKNKIMKYLVPLLLVISIYFHDGACWFFSNNHQTEEKQVVVKQSVPFEVKSVDESFLQTVEDLSHLDRCHHLVIAEIQTTCSSMSEEELGKLAVHLLNCQATAEERQTFQCTSHMTLAECTKLMDPTTWNAYQIVSNRARAVCYATRQQHFRMKTEYTVNKLVHTTEQQLGALDHMGKSHERLIDLTSDTLTKVKSGQEDLLTQHESMRRQQEGIQSSVSATIRDIYREKALVAAGNREFAKMADTVKQKLDNATQLLMEQEAERKENHDQVVGDLSSIRHQADHVLHKIGSSGKMVEELQAHNEKYYSETLDKLHKLNSTLGYMLTALQGIGDTLEMKINWLLSFMGDSEDALAVLQTITLHTCYLLLAAISASFLHTPIVSRVVLLLLVPLNAWAQLKQGTSLGFLPMTLFILATTLVNITLRCLYGITVILQRLGRRLFALTTSKDVVPVDTQCAIVDTTMSPGHRLSQDEYNSLIKLLEKLKQSGDVVLHNQSNAELETTNQIIDSDSVVTPLVGELHPDLNHNPREDVSFKREPHIGQHEPIPDDDVINQEWRFEEAFEMDKVQEVDNVRKHLLKSLADTSVLSLPLTPSSTPRSSTPVRTPKRTPRSSRQSTPNRSFARPQCLSMTKAGNPCKNLSSDGSAFCRRHQVTPSQC